MSSGEDGGELTVKKAAVALLVLALLVVFAAPVMAEPTNGQKVAASMSQKGVTYKKLNETCIAAGLPPNTYPLLTVSNGFLVPGNPNLEQIRDASNYWNVTDLTIGTKHFKGYARYVYNGLSGRNFFGMVIHHFGATYYIGALGDLSNGFEGWVQFKVYGWFAGTQTIELATWHAVLHGFGSFSGQTLELSYDATSWAQFTGTGPWTGYCNKG